MPVVPIYRMNWQNVEGANMELKIFDYNGVLPDEPGLDFTEIPLIAAREPFITRYINTEERIYNPILGRSATIQFQNTNNAFLSTFSSGEDNRFYSIATNGLVNVFEGYLVMEDNSEPYLPKGQIVTLTATDNLGLLKTIELLKIDGTKFRNENKLIDYVAACLHGTGLKININVAQSLFENSHINRTTDPAACAWNQTWVNALTFEKDINEAEDRYTVLTKILSSWGCRLSYYAGEWWIIRMDEYKNGTSYYTKYDYAGAVIAGGSISANRLKVIDHQSRQDRFFINKSTLVRAQRPRKFASTLYPYEFPKEIICNIDFTRGDIVIDDTDPDEITYEIDCWTFEAGTAAGVPGVTPFGDAVIKKIFIDGYEKEHFAIVPNNDTGSTYQWIKSEPIEVIQKDKATVSVDFKLNLDLSGGDAVMWMQVMLEGAAQTYVYGASILQPAGWYVYDPLSLDQPYIKQAWQRDDVDEMNYQSLSGDLGPMPEDGFLHIKLFSWGASGLSRIDVDYANLQFTYKPFINSSYQKYTSEQYKVSQAGNFSAREENELHLSDGQSKLFKGALQKWNGSVYQLTTSWSDWALDQENGGTSSGLIDDRFAKWQAYNVWNQFKTTKRIFDANLKGLDSNTVHYCDIVHKYQNNVASDHNQNKFFVLMHMQQNWRTCQITGTMIEVHDTTETRDYDSEFSFKYLTR